MINVLNYQEIVDKIASKYENILSTSLIASIVNDVLNIVTIDDSENNIYKAMHDGVIALVEQLYPGNIEQNNNYTNDIDNFTMFDNNIPTPVVNVQQVLPVDITSYITTDSIHTFKENMFKSMLTQINIHRKEQGLSEIDGGHLRSSCMFRTCYLKYGMKYLALKNDNKNNLNINGDDLLLAFFLQYIFCGNDAYHEENSNTPQQVRYPFLSTKNQGVYSLLSEEEYIELLNKRIRFLLPGLYDKYPNYVLSEEDKNKLRTFSVERLCKKGGN